MTDHQKTPNWTDMMTLTDVQRRIFAAEQWNVLMRMMYNDIILDPDRDNNELVSVFLNMTAQCSMLKMMFNVWVEGFVNRHNGPITYKEILQFTSYLAMCEERYAVKLVAEHLDE